MRASSSCPLPVARCSSRSPISEPSKLLGQAADLVAGLLVFANHPLEPVVDAGGEAADEIAELVREAGAGGKLLETVEDMGQRDLDIALRRDRCRSSGSPSMVRSSRPPYSSRDWARRSHDPCSVLMLSMAPATPLSVVVVISFMVSSLCQVTGPAPVAALRSPSPSWRSGHVIFPPGGDQARVVRAQWSAKRVMSHGRA